MEVPQIENDESMDSENKASVVNVETPDIPVQKPKESEPEVQPVKKSKEGRERKKDDRSAEQVLRAISNLPTSDEKITAVCNKYSEIIDENRKLQMSVKQCDKRVAALQREKEQLQAEQSKAVLTRSRLESLCRELQRQNKAIKEESLLRIREEEEKRKVVSAKFQTTLSEITALMQQNNENNSKLRDENIEMQNKFKSVCEQYELREQQVEKISKQMQLESQLADAKLAKVKIEMVAEKELLANEKRQLMIELATYQAKCQELQTTEAALRSQISMYTEKYDEFQNALARSNQIYGGFKTEMEKMSKKITKLEKETSTWKMKWESSHKALLQMAAEKQQRDADLALSARQLAQLQKLCRTLQSERSSLLSQLKNEGLTPKVAGEEKQECEHQPASEGSDNINNAKKSVAEDKVPIDGVKSNEKNAEQVNDVKQSVEEVNKKTSKPKVNEEKSATQIPDSKEIAEQNSQPSVAKIEATNAAVHDIQPSSNKVKAHDTESSGQKEITETNGQPPPDKVEAKDTTKDSSQPSSCKVDDKEAAEHESHLTAEANSNSSSQSNGHQQDVAEPQKELEAPAPAPAPVSAPSSPAKGAINTQKGEGKSAQDTLYTPASATDVKTASDPLLANGQPPAVTSTDLPSGDMGNKGGAHAEPRKSKEGSKRRKK